MKDLNIISFRMERQCLIRKADEAEYIKLYRDTQPGLNVYWNGFGEPPTLSFRANFDDIAFNRDRQLNRKLIKGRFATWSYLSRSIANRLQIQPKSNCDY